jgi:hypothetical protein
LEEIHERPPEAPVPKHDGAATVLSLRDGAFEVSIIERMILHRYGQATIVWIK